MLIKMELKQIIGLILIIFSPFSFGCIFSAGIFLRIAWISFFSFILPFIILAIGLFLLLYNIGDKKKAKRAIKIIGIAFILIGILVWIFLYLLATSSLGMKYICGVNYNNSDCFEGIALLGAGILLGFFGPLLIIGIILLIINFFIKNKGNKK